MCVCVCMCVIKSCLLVRWFGGKCSWKDGLSEKNRNGDRARSSSSDSCAFFSVVVCPASLAEEAFVSFSWDPEGGQPSASRQWRPATDRTLVGEERRRRSLVIVISHTLSRVSKRGLGRRAGTIAGCLVVTLVRYCSWRMTLSNGWTRSAGSCAFSEKEKRETFLGTN